MKQSRFGKMKWTHLIDFSWIWLFIFFLVFNIECTHTLLVYWIVFIPYFLLMNLLLLFYVYVHIFCIDIYSSDLHRGLPRTSYPMSSFRFLIITLSWIIRLRSCPPHRIELRLNIPHWPCMGNKLVQFNSNVLCFFCYSLFLW